jgi:fatty-acyl-CoA synthase
MSWKGFYEFDADTVYLSPAPLYHAAPNRYVQRTIDGGGTAVITRKFDAAACLALIEKFRVTHSQWVPTMFVRLLALPDSMRKTFDLSSHRCAIHAAAPCPVLVKQAMIDWWGPIVDEYYASSEAHGSTLITAEEWLAHPGSVGRAMGGALHILDEEGNELPPGEAGEIYFDTASSFEYLNDPAKTAATTSRQGWRTVGDIGYLDDDGYLYLTDRRHHMIISGGVNIYPQEIENLLVTHAKVMDAAVIGAPCPDLGEKVVAVVQPRDMADAGPALEAELREFLSVSLSKIKMPKQFDFRPDLPREANGKLYKRELRDEYAAKAGAA